MKLGSSLKNLHIYLSQFLIVIKLVPSRCFRMKTGSCLFSKHINSALLKTEMNQKKSKMMSLSANRKNSFWLTPMMYSGIKTQSKNK